jgi:hypothetical protein
VCCNGRCLFALQPIISKNVSIIIFQLTKTCCMCLPSTRAALPAGCAACAAANGWTVRPRVSFRPQQQLNRGACECRAALQRNVGRVRRRSREWRSTSDGAQLQSVRTSIVIHSVHSLLHNCALYHRATQPCHRPHIIGVSCSI